MDVFPRWLYEASSWMQLDTEKWTIIFRSILVVEWPQVYADRYAFHCNCFMKLLCYIAEHIYWTCLQLIMKISINSRNFRHRSAVSIECLEIFENSVLQIHCWAQSIETERNWPNNWLIYSVSINRFYKRLLTTEKLNFQSVIKIANSEALRVFKFYEIGVFVPNFIYSCCTKIRCNWSDMDGILRMNSSHFKWFQRTIFETVRLLHS